MSDQSVVTSDSLDESTDGSGVSEAINPNRVTWLLAVKDGMPYVSQTLASIAEQTYKFQEIIAWDNGSVDGTPDELRKWIPDRIPGQVIDNNPLPLALCRAKLVELANTEYCAILDADDLADPDRLAKQVSYLDSHPEIGVLGTQMREIDSQSRILPPRRPYPTSHDDIVNTLIAENPVGQPAILFRKEAVLKAGNYQPVGPVNIEDYDLWMRVAQHAKIENLDEVLTSYRVHPKSTTQIMLANNKLLAAVDERIALQSPLLFGIDYETALQLRRHNISFALPLLQKIARHLDSLKGNQPGDTFLQPTFIDAARALLAPWDRLTSIVLAYTDRRPNAYRLELKSFLFAISPKIGLMRRVLPLFRRYRDYRKREAMRSWAEQRSAALPAEIDGSLQVIGRPDFEEFVKLGQFGWIERDCTLWFSGDEGADPQLTIGNRTFIGQHTYIGAYQPITIGSYSMIGAYSYLISANHRFDRRDIPIVDQGFVGAPIVIGDDVWLGTHVVVLPGVTIGKGAIVAAGSIVNKSIPPYQIWGGTPARFIKERP